MSGHPLGGALAGMFKQSSDNGQTWHEFVVEDELVTDTDMLTMLLAEVRAVAVDVAYIKQAVVELEDLRPVLDKLSSGPLAKIFGMRG